MKKRIIALSLLTAMLLTGCGSKAFTGEKTAEATDDKGNKTVVTVNFEEGTATDVEIDVVQADGSSKYEAAKTGAYVMGGESGNEWHTQIDLLEDAIVANKFDLSKITYTTEEGNTDAVAGVSIKVKGYVDLVQEALDQVK